MRSSHFSCGSYRHLVYLLIDETYTFDGAYMKHTDRPWLDTTLTAEQRAALLLAAMTNEEKLAQMVQISSSLVTKDGANKWAQLGAGSFLHTLGDDARRLQKIATETRLGIPVIFGIDAIHGHAIHNGATVFPSQLALAASWNPELAELTGTITAREVAAEGLHWTFSPVFCLGRDPRWGRMDETFGEDPYLAGKMGAAMVRGYQGDNPAHPERIIACAKHYIAYGESTGGRDSYDTPVSMRTVRDIFLPPFEEAVKAGCLTFMAGYESIDRIPCSAHRELLRNILKDELKFEGFVVTDWSNVTSLHTRQRVARSLKEASEIAVHAGNDMIMTTPEFYEAAVQLLQEGRVSVQEVDEAVRRILLVKFKAGLFDVRSKVKTLPLADDPEAARDALIFGTKEHLEASLQCARESITLLKNKMVEGKPALPVSGPRRNKDRTVKTIGIFGPNADSVRAQFGDWTFFTHPVPHYDAKPSFKVTTVKDGITALAKQEGISILFDKGCNLEKKEPHTIAKACKLAAKCDIVFVAVGDNLFQTGETKDRANLALEGAQNELVEALSACCREKGIPLVAILVNGKPLEFCRVDTACDAVLETFNSGTLGGKAVAEIIFGHAEPKGRLPVSFPRTTGQIPVYYNQLPGWHEGKYVDCDATPLYVFGQGLSWTSFRYDKISLSKNTATQGERIGVRVSITNTGDRTGTETIQLYATRKYASIVTPVKELKAFAKLEIQAGKSAEIIIPIEVDSLSLVNAQGIRCLEEGEIEIRAAHDSQDCSLDPVILTITQT